MRDGLLVASEIDAELLELVDRTEKDEAKFDKKLGQEAKRRAALAERQGRPLD